MITIVASVRRPAVRVVSGTLRAVATWRMLAIRFGENPPWHDTLSIGEEFACSLSVPLDSLRVLNVRRINTHEMN